jgi:hypothetical protein
MSELNVAQSSPRPFVSIKDLADCKGPISRASKYESLVMSAADPGYGSSVQWRFVHCQVFWLFFQGQRE